MSAIQAAETVINNATYALRFIAAGLAIYNISWTWRGQLEFLRGKFTLTATYESVVFWMAVSVVLFQVSFALGSNLATRLAAYIVLTIVMGLAAYGRYIGLQIRSRNVEFVHDHLDVALAIADLAVLDKDKAYEMAALCRREAAKIVSNG